jgi:hypothetical protein
MAPNPQDEVMAELELLRGRVGGLECAAADHKRSEEALRGPLRQQWLAFEANPHPMWIFDAETLRFLAVNAAALLATARSAC